jgi:hypothetical protein
LDIAIKYGVPKRTVSTILKNKEKVIEAIEEGTVSQNSKRLKKEHLKTWIEPLLTGSKLQEVKTYLYREH